MPEREDFELYLDAMEISKLHQMMDAAEIMDAHDRGEDGDKEPTSELGK